MHPVNTHTLRSPSTPAPAITYVLGVSGRVESILQGSPLTDPKNYGWNSEDERTNAAVGHVRGLGDVGAGRQAGCSGKD